MFFKLNNVLHLKASTLMEALVALAITSIIMWMVFTSMHYNLLPINPQRKLDAVFIADSLIQLTHYEKEDSLDLFIRNFKVSVITSPYNDSLPLGFIRINVYATPKHLLVGRKKLITYEN